MYRWHLFASTLATASQQLVATLRKACWAVPLTVRGRWLPPSLTVRGCRLPPLVWAVCKMGSKKKKGISQGSTAGGARLLSFPPSVWATFFLRDQRSIWPATSAPRFLSAAASLIHVSLAAWTSAHDESLSILRFCFIRFASLRFVVSAMAVSPGLP